MKEGTIKHRILQFVERNDGAFGRKIEDFIRQGGTKASNASRRCRELVEDGYLIAEYVKVEGVPTKIVRYSLPKPKGYQIYTDPVTGKELARVAIR